MDSIAMRSTSVVHSWSTYAIPKQHRELRARRFESVRMSDCCGSESGFFGSVRSSENVKERTSAAPGQQKKTSARRSVSGIVAAAATFVSTDDHDAKTTSRFRISKKFAELRQTNRVAFIPYLTAGDPNVETTVAAVKLLEKCGADIIELGIPYSDPLADGPVIQAATTRAISGGTNVDSVLTLMREGLSDVKIPIVIFIYYNPLLKRGLSKFLEEAKAAGASGLVVPDLPLEETRKLSQLTSAAGLELVLLTTPTTPTVRMKAIAAASQGFIYLVSLTGVTGARSSIEGRVENLLKDIKEVSDKPVAVGFGVSTPEHAAKLAEWGADGVIIGSKVVKLLGESGLPEEGLRAVEEFAIQIRAALP